MLRQGNVHSAEDWRSVLEPVVARYRGTKIRSLLSGRCSLCQPGDLYEFLEAEGYEYAIRLPANDALLREIEPLLTRPVGRPPNEAHGPVYGLSVSGARVGINARRVVAKVEWHRGELFPRIGFIVTNLSRPAKAGGAVLQSAGNGGAVDQGGQECGEMDTAVVP